MFTALQAANVDWNVVAGAFATFVVTALVTALGFKRGLKRIKIGEVDQVRLAGAALMDNISMQQLTDALRENTDCHRQIHTCLIEIKTILQLTLNKHG